MKVVHSILQSGEWFNLSLFEQMGNVGSEIHRALIFKNKDSKLFENAIFRALELLDLTLADQRWRKRLKEIARARELVCASLNETNEYNASLEDLDKYFHYFALAARLNK